MNNSHYVIGIGAANMDVHASLVRGSILHDSNLSYNHTSCGGVCRNVIDNLARQGLKTAMLTSLGDDLYGKQINSCCENIGIDMSHVLVRSDYPTASYIAMIDDTGDMLIAACDARIIENIPLSYFEDNKDFIQNADALVCDPNLTIEQLVKIKEIAGDVKIFIDPVSTAKAERIKDYLNLFYFVKPNELELEILSGIHIENNDDIERATQIVLNKGAKCIAVSLGAKGCYYADKKGRKMFRSLAPSIIQKVEMKNATGAGDAFMAGMVHSFVVGRNIEESLDYALASGAIAVMSDDTINPTMSDNYVKEFI